MISIHAPRAGRDTPMTWRSCSLGNFNPRAPCGARLGEGAILHGRRYFNPRAPCGARLGLIRYGDSKYPFQSTRPVRGATFTGAGVFTIVEISIHAPRAGRDLSCFGAPAWRWNFNPRAPCGARPIGGINQWRRRYFNPRAPCGARQQKYTKLLYTLLRQKAILRQFHAKRRLLKRFSTYKYRNTFLICSANRMGKICTLPLRTTRSLDLPEGMSACSQSARFCFRTFFPSSKTADYPALDP